MLPVPKRVIFNRPRMLRIFFPKKVRMIKIYQINRREFSLHINKVSDLKIDPTSSPTCHRKQKKKGDKVHHTPELSREPVFKERNPEFPKEESAPGGAARRVSKQEASDAELKKRCGLPRGLHVIVRPFDTWDFGMQAAAALE